MEKKIIYLSSLEKEETGTGKIHSQYVKIKMFLNYFWNAHLQHMQTLIMG